MDDNVRNRDFWLNLNSGWEDMNCKWEFEKFWGRGSYPPEKILISSEDYDTIMKSLKEPPKPIPALTELLNRKTPFEND
jgi:hypothetical protein